MASPKMVMPNPNPNPRTLAELGEIASWLVSEGYEPTPAAVGAVHLAGKSWALGVDGFIEARHRGRSAYRVNCLGVLAELNKMATIPERLSAKELAALRELYQLAVDAQKMLVAVVHALDDPELTDGQRNRAAKWETALSVRLNAIDALGIFDYQEPLTFKCPHCGADDVGEAHPDRCGICGAVGTDSAMINSLKDWVARGIGEDREFTIRYLGGIKFPWNVRLEDEHQSWSHDEETHKSLGAAIVAAMRSAKQEGMP